MIYIIVFKRKSSWKEIKKHIFTWPSKRYGGTLNNYNGYLYLYGGYNYVGNHNPLNDLNVYNIKSNKWKRIKSKFNSPSCSQHTTSIYNHYLIIFGGLCNKQRERICHNDIYIFNILTNTWKIIKSNNKPIPRFAHGMCIINNKLIIHGGLDVNNIPLNDIHSISLNDNILNDNKPSTVHWNTIHANMDPVFSHLMVPISDISHSFIVFGGRKKYKITEYNRELILYKHYPSNGDTFIRAYFRQLYSDILIPDLVLHLIIQYFGMLDQKYSYKCTPINSRGGHNGCILYSNNNRYLFIFGGWLHNALNDCYLIHINRLS